MDHFQDLENIGETSYREQRIIVTPHAGEAFKKDNERVWKIIQQLVLSGPGWPFIRKFAARCNGKMAWKALVKHYLSDGAMATEKKRAYDTLASLKYLGETNKYTFETYVGKFQDCFEILAEYREPVAENKKVTDFINGINVANPKMRAAIAHIEASEEMLEDFTATSDYLSTVVTRHKTELKRSIKSAQTGRNSGGTGSKGKGTFRFTPTHKNVPKPIWLKLTDEQKRQCLDLRAKHKAGKGKKRKAAAAATEAESSDEEQAAGLQMLRKKKSRKSE